MARQSYAARNERAKSLGFRNVSHMDREIRAARKSLGINPTTTDPEERKRSRAIADALIADRVADAQAKAAAKLEAARKRAAGLKQIHAGGDVISTTSRGRGGELVLRHLEAMGNDRVSLTVTLPDGEEVTIYEWGMPADMMAQMLREGMVGGDFMTGVAAMAWDHGGYVFEGTSSASAIGEMGATGAGALTAQIQRV